jgi:hypothetical protein
MTSAQTLTNKTFDGVTPATHAFLDPTSSVQTQLNSKTTVALASPGTIYADYLLNSATCSTGTVIPDLSGNGHNAVVVGTLTCDGLGFTGWSTSNYLSLSSGTPVTYSAVHTVEAFVDATANIVINSVQQAVVLGSTTAADLTFAVASHYPASGDTAAHSANTMPTVFVGNAVFSQFGEQVPGAPHFVAWQLGAGTYHANDQFYIDGIPSVYVRAQGAGLASSRIGTATIGQTANGPTALISTFKVFRVTLRNAQVSDAAIYQDYSVMKTGLQNGGVNFTPTPLAGLSYTGTEVTIVSDSTSVASNGETASWPVSLSLTDPNLTRVLVGASFPGIRAADVAQSGTGTIRSYKDPLGRNIIVYKLGVNDIDGTNTAAQADSHFYIYALPWVQARIAEGYTVVWPTLTACGSTATGTCETSRLEWNLLIQKHAAAVGYFVPDIHADPRFQTYTDTNYFMSGGSNNALHLTDAGNVLFAAYISAAINELYAVQNYSTATVTGASNYTFTDADYWVTCNTSGTITLPYPTAKTGQKRIIQNFGGAGTCAVNVAAAPTSTTSPITTTVNGTSTYSIAASTTKTFIADATGANWIVEP